MIYVISLLCGIVPNGVDKAQGYRNRLFINLGLPARYVFLTQPSRRDIDYHCSCGILKEQMISMPQAFTDNNDVGFEPRDFYANGQKIRTEYYSDTLLYADEYVYKDNGGWQESALSQRTYYNRDGSVGLEEIFLSNSRRGNLYTLPDGSSYYEKELLEPFAVRLKLCPADTVIIDTPIIPGGDAVRFACFSASRIITVIHSGHYYKNGENPASVTTLNPEYMYLFKYSDLVDTIVVSTVEQKSDLQALADSYGCAVNNVAVIPAGGVTRLLYPEGKRQSCSLLTVSRIEERKHTDWIAKAVIIAHKEVPVTLDIYGDGNMSAFLSKVQSIIAESNADSYIRLKGHVDVSEVYKEYELYISASLWETLGLSLMEAVASGCAMVGLDMHYGNRLFIKPGENGFLVDFDLDRLCDDSAYEEDVIDLMAKRIVDIFSDTERLNRFSEYSYKIAKRFETEKIEAAWQALLTTNNEGVSRDGNIM